MARPTIKSFNWSALAERVAESDKNLYAAFKSKSDQYLRRVQVNPESPPKFDWTFYKKNIPLAGMVDRFQKEYESLKVPYPPDNYTVKLSELEKDYSSKIDNFVKESNVRIEEYRQKADKLKNQIPYAQMTMEDFKDIHPEEALDPLNNPTFWPHTEEYQSEYIDKMKPEDE
ncbi:ATP synthase subunit d, mitochondrial [Orussus abietinus]|uniref:ATP synthase subunit d, mitochondrial n=1 Tax=Orussus abietinus TaxID=222816 RepID=UPI000626E612|nr:ATP synthase subunit d, mitochondrial [Orussus abietinus]